MQVTHSEERLGTVRKIASLYRAMARTAPQSFLPKLAYGTVTANLGKLAKHAGFAFRFVGGVQGALNRR